MTQYRYEVRGYYFKKESKMDAKEDFICSTPLCPYSSHEAKQYVENKLKKYQAFIWFRNKSD